MKKGKKDGSFVIYDRYKFTFGILMVFLQALMLIYSSWQGVFPFDGGFMTTITFGAVAIDLIRLAVYSVLGIWGAVYLLTSVKRVKRPDAVKKPLRIRCVVIQPQEPVDDLPPKYNSGKRVTPELIGSHVIKCPLCGNWQPEDSVTCFYCGAVFEGEAVRRDEYADDRGPYDDVWEYDFEEWDSDGYAEFYENDGWEPEERYTVVTCISPLLIMHMSKNKEREEKKEKKEKWRIIIHDAAVITMIAVPFVGIVIWLFSIAF